jgi:hypothetical protein
MYMTIKGILSEKKKRDIILKKKYTFLVVFKVTKLRMKLTGIPVQLFR